MTANDRQVGGAHYKGAAYQHWDFVTEAGLPYLIGCATKYVARHRKKNGKEDLEKALHYIDKAEEALRQRTPLDIGLFWAFVMENDLTMEEGAAIYYICVQSWGPARLVMDTLLAYVNFPSGGE